MDDKKKKPVKVHHFPFNGLYEIEKRCPNCMMKFKKRWGKCPKCKQEIDWQMKLKDNNKQEGR